MPGNPGGQVPQDGYRKLADRVAALESRLNAQSGNTVDRGFSLNPLTTPALFSCAGNATWRLDPLEAPVSVSVLRGRLLIIISAVLFSSVGASNAVMSWTVTDAFGSVVAAADNQRALVAATASYPAAGYGSSSYAYMHTGLASGTYSVRSNYRCDQYGGTSDTTYFQQRTLLAWPI